jgi:alanine dehydrogenase
MPGQYPRTSTIALTNATLPYALRLADHGLSALKESPALLSGLNTYDGKVTFKAVSEALGYAYHDPRSLL